jgi:hypothetical protein
MACSARPKTARRKAALLTGGVLAGAAALTAGCTNALTLGPAGHQVSVSASAGPARGLTAPLNGSNLDYSGVAQPFSAPGVVSALDAFRSGTLRYPGGTIANYWQWQPGRVEQPAQTSADGTREMPGLAHSYGFTLGTLHSIVQRSGTIPVFDLNVLTSTLTDQLAMLKAASAMGIPVRYIELGNEFYLSDSNYTDAFPTAAAYADLVKRWAPALHAAFPTADIAAVGSLPQATPREQSWNSTVLSIAGPYISALTLHDYSAARVAGQVHQGGASPTTADVLAAAHRNWDRAQQVIAAIPARYRIWFTEFNLSKQARGAGAPPRGVTWVHGLYAADMMLLYDQSPRVQLNDYWDLFSAPSVGAYTSGASPRPTAAGSALTALTNASWQATSVRTLSFSGAPSLPGGSPGLAGVTFSGPHGTRTVLLNLTGQTLAVRSGPAVPGGATAQSIGANPAAQVSGPGSIARHTATVGSTLTVPPYSVVAVGFTAPTPAGALGTFVPTVKNEF